jgi:uncharacterized membrane protein YeaQ/YmgE (transglycosylase-associated protein family)
MENSVRASGKQGQAFVDTATDKVRSGISDAGATLKQGVDAVTDFAGRARDTASSASRSVIDYTRENPVKALAIAAVSGAVLITIAKAIRGSRD